MGTRDGRNATQPYRVRAGKIWYWVDPTAPAGQLEPRDTVVIYPMGGDPIVAILQSPFKPDDEVAARLIEFSSLDGERFAVPASDVAAIHLASIDDVQT